MIRVIAFDFGNVIGRFDHQRGCRQIAALTGGRASPQDVFCFLYESRRFEAIENGNRDPHEFLAELATQFAIADLTALESAYSNIFTRDEAVCSLVRRIGVPKLLASNTDALHWRVIATMFAAELAGFAPGGLIRSNEVRCRKPAAAFFHALLATARTVTADPDLEPADMLFVDDLQVNCAGAADAGLSVHWHHSADRLLKALGEYGITLEGDAPAVRCA